MTQRADRLRWRQASERLQRLRNRRSGDPEVPVATGDLDTDEVAIDQPGEVCR
ncbi:hypothetical protein [Ferrimicrobium sp.]